MTLASVSSQPRAERVVNRLQAAQECCEAMGSFSTAALSIRQSAVLQITSQAHPDDPSLVDLELSLSPQTGHALDDTPVTLGLYPVFRTSPSDQSEAIRVFTLSGTNARINDIPQDNYMIEVISASDSNQ